MTEQIDSAHPLDGCADDELYKIMMSERTELIKARRDAEDTLIKTIIQLSSSLITLTAGFVSLTSVRIVPHAIWPLSITLIGLLLAVVSGLLENIFSSRAYSAQQKNLEEYFSKRIKVFEEPKENRYIRITQRVSFGMFSLSLIAIGVFGVLQAGGSNG
ncbi:hypothetical protein [Sphingomonas sp. Leaf23]|uniref:hypothetical protein n=1 Tax=Sphingomonas sp. Leaf23 TaxID=1735689 RepID=UPI0012E29399|nr:hypothetical protein [Sphingomonas sp. Leaf23]